MTQADFTTLVQEVETILEQHGVHLTTDAFNNLFDYLEGVVLKALEQ